MTLSNFCTSKSQLWVLWIGDLGGHIGDSVIRLHLRLAREGFSRIILLPQGMSVPADLCLSRVLQTLTIAFAAGSGPRNTIKAWMKRTDPSYPMVQAPLPEKAFHRNEQDAGTEPAQILNRQLAHPTRRTYQPREMMPLHLLLLRQEE